MFSHSEIWAAIDALASKHSLSTSGLAKKAGLDPTTFNKSKRTTAHEKPRWPSTESIAKILGVTGTNLSELADMVKNGVDAVDTSHLLCTKLSSLTDKRLFNGNSRPTRNKGWYKKTLSVTFPTSCFAIEIDGSHESGCYRTSDLLIAETLPPKSVKQGERIIMLTASGELLLHEVVGISSNMIETRALDNQGNHQRTDGSKITLLARILWASQSQV